MKRGFSLLEVLVGMVIFLCIFLGSMKLYTESNLPRQAMIRDFAIALNICERFLNSLQNDIATGKAPPPSDKEIEVTEAVLESPDIQDYLKVFSGGVGKDATELVFHFRAFLKVKDEPDQLKRLQMRFEWGNKPRHQFSLQALVFAK